MAHAACLGAAALVAIHRYHIRASRGPRALLGAGPAPGAGPEPCHQAPPGRTSVLGCSRFGGSRRARSALDTALSACAVSAQ